MYITKKLVGKNLMYKKEKHRKYISLAIIFIFIGVVFVNVVSYAAENESIENEEANITNSFTVGYINITVNEAWDMLNSTDDGKQILIDVRRFQEYRTERIEPPDPKDWPRWFPYEFTKDGSGPIKNEGFLLKIFMSIYKDKEIIIYCRTARRTGIAAQILVDNGFEGTVYNMLGGITEWKDAGLPTVEGLLPFLNK